MIIGAYLEHMAPDHPAGAEWAVHDAFSWLAKRGHDCRIVSRLDYSQTRTDAGVLLYGHPTDEILAQHYQECDVMLTQLDGSMHAQLLAAAYQTPLVHYLHSAFQIEQVIDSCCALLIYNAEHVAQAVGEPGLVLRPPIDADRVRVAQPGACTTLVNLSAAKGAATLWRLATDLEATPFLGVQGAYGDQQIGPKGLATATPDETDTGLPRNLAVIGAVRDIREAFGFTRQLLVLSATETYGRIAAEACVSGIPTIAVDTPGLRECLGEAAVYIDRDETGALTRAIKAGYTDAWEDASIAASARWHGTLSPRQETELIALERELVRITNDQPRMTL